MYDYVNIPVRRDTKKLVDVLRKNMGTKTYDETLRHMARTNSIMVLKDLRGIFKGMPRFERDKRERHFG